MSAELSNKVNQLCQKIKTLSKRQTTISNAELDKVYLFAKIDFISDPSSTINILPNNNIPYDTTLASNGITLNPSGGAVVNSDGVYNLSFSTIPNFVGPTRFGIAVNGNIQNGTLSYSNDATGPQITIPHTNSVILNLNAGDVVTIVNITLDNLSQPVQISLTGQLVGDNVVDTNLSIHKI